MKKVMLLASENMCDVLRRELDDKYITLSCYDPAAGSELLQQNPDALILDLFLSGASGLDFLKTNTLQLPAVVLALTYFVSDALLQELSGLGVSSLILVPFRISYMEEILSDYIQKKNPFQ